MKFIWDDNLTIKVDSIFYIFLQSIVVNYGVVELTKYLLFVLHL